MSCSIRVQLKSNDACPSLDKGPRNRTRSGADVKYEIAGRDTGGVNESLRPLTFESVPSPSRPLLGHGTPS